MLLIIIINLVVVIYLCRTAIVRGFESVLPQAAFIIVVLPFESQIRLPGLFDLTTQRLVIMVLAALYATHGMRERALGDERKLPLKYILSLLLVWMAISSASSVVKEVSFKATLSQLLDFIVPYYIYSRTISKVETVHKILWAFVAALGLCSVFGCLEVYQGWRVLTLFPPAAHRFGDMAGAVADRGVRAQSTFGHPILFGAALALCIPLALYLVTLAKTSREKVSLWVMIMLMFACIYQTTSRGPWLALTLSLLILLLFGDGAIRKYLMIVSMLIVVVLVARPGVFKTISDLYGNTRNPDTAQGESYQWRYTLYVVAERELGESVGRAMVGFGPESFPYLGLVTEFGGKTVSVDSCDSSVVELMMDTGYVGVGIVGVLLLKVAIVAIAGYRRMQKPRNMLYLVLFSNVCAFSLLMTNVQLFGWGQQSFVLWILIALIMTYRDVVETSGVGVDDRVLGEVGPSEYFTEQTSV
jgi:hypothetical protein